MTVNDEGHVWLTLHSGSQKPASRNRAVLLVLFCDVARRAFGSRGLAVELVDISRMPVTAISSVLGIGALMLSSASRYPRTTTT